MNDHGDALRDAARAHVQRTRPPELPQAVASPRGSSGAGSLPAPPVTWPAAMGGAVGGAAGLLRLPLDPPERVQQQAARAPPRAMLAPSVPAAPGTCLGMPSDAGVIQAYRDQASPTPELTLALERTLRYLLYLVRSHHDAEVSVMPDRRRPVVILSDAMGVRASVSPTGRPQGHLGFIILHPTKGAFHSSAPVPDWLVALFDRLSRNFGGELKDTLITPFEGAAMLAPYFTLPWLVAGMPVIHWIDNSGMLLSTVKGYSSSPEMAIIIDTYKWVCLKLHVLSWLDFVPSESNASDGPSRWVTGVPTPVSHDVPLWQLGRFVQMVLPQLADSRGEWLSGYDIWDLWASSLHRHPPA